MADLKTVWKALKDDRGEIIPKHYKYDLRWMTISEYEMLSAMQNIYKGESEV